VIAALTAAGWQPTNSTSWILPHNSGHAEKRLKELKSVPGTIALYESPLPYREASE